MEIPDVQISLENILKEASITGDVTINPWVGTPEILSIRYQGRVTNPDDPEGAQLRLQLEVHPTVCYLHDIEIELGKRKQGYGTRVMRAIEQFAQYHGCNRLELTSNPQSTPFYLKLGYEIKDALGTFKKDLDPVQAI